MKNKIHSRTLCAAEVLLLSHRNMTSVSCLSTTQKAGVKEPTALPSDCGGWRGDKVTEWS